MTAIYPGSFDPATNGHLDIILRASKISENLIVAVLDNPSKKPLFTVEERVNHLERITTHIDNVRVMAFSGLLVDFVKKNNASVIIRGLRALTDFEYEFQMALTNRELESQVETLFIPTSIQYLFLSSSVVKEIAKFNGCFKDMVPEEICSDLENKFKNSNK